MTTSCCADGNILSGATPSSKQRWRTSNRIKLSRELMIKLTAAAAALSNGGGDQRVRDVRNGSRVMLNNGTFAQLSSSSSTNNLREFKSQTNNNSGGTTAKEGALLTERRGNNSNTCDNSFNKSGQLQTSWPQSLLQQHKQQQQQLQQQTSPLTPSQLSESDLVKTSSIKNDCSSIWAASVGATLTSSDDSLPILNQCNTRPVRQQQQHNSMPIHNNKQPEAPPMHTRSGAIKRCYDDNNDKPTTAVTKTSTGCCSIATIDNGDDDDDNDINKERATSIGGGKPLVSDADTIIQTNTCHKSTSFKRDYSPELSIKIQPQNKKSSSSSSDTCLTSGFSKKSFVFDVDLQNCQNSSSVVAVVDDGAVKGTQEQPKLIETNHECSLFQKQLAATTTIVRDNLRRRKQRHCNEKNKTSCCLVESHEFNIFRKIGPSWRCRRGKKTNREPQSNCCSPKIRQMSLPNSIDNDTSSSFTTFSSIKTNKNNNNNTFAKLNEVSLNCECFFNDSLSSNSNSKTKITSGNELSLPERYSSHKRVLHEQQLNNSNNNHHHHHRYSLLYLERGSLRQRHVFKKQQQQQRQRIRQQKQIQKQRQQEDVLNGLTNLTKNSNHLLFKQSEKSSSFKVIKVDPKLNLTSIDTKTNDDNDNDNNNNNSTNYNNDNNNCKSLLFINKEYEEQQRKQVTRIVSNHSSVIILKAIKDVDSSNLHLNDLSTFSWCSIKDDNDNDVDYTLRSTINNHQQIKDISTKTTTKTTTTTTTSCKTSSDKIKAHYLCYSPEIKPIKIVVEKEKGAQKKSDKQVLVEISSLLNLKDEEKDEERDEKRKNKENLLINKIERENTSSCSNINTISSNSKSSNSCLVDRGEGNIKNHNNSSKRSEIKSFECDNNNLIRNNLKNQIEIINKKQKEEEEIVAQKEEFKRKKLRPNNNDDLGNNYYQERRKSATRTNIKRGKYHRNSSLFIWFSMILIGCLLLQFESSSSSADHEKSSSSSSSSSLFGFVSPIGRVNGQSTSDEFSRAVLATMSTQSPSSILNNSIGQQFSTTSSIDEESYLINNQDNNNNQSPKTMMNQYDQDQDQNSNNNNNNNSSNQTTSSFFDKFLDFGRIFIIGAIIIGDICGNSLVILSVCRHSKLRVTTNWFVVSLACADILVAVFAMTFNASVIISGRWLFKPWVCDFWNSCDVLASTASILHLCCISIDRYIAITRPLDYPMKITTRRVIYALCGVWISSALLSYLPIFTGVYTTSEHIKWLNDNPEQCDFVVNRVYAIVSSSISFWIPSSIMVFTYYRIYKEATRQEKFMYKQQSMMPAPMANHHHHHHHHDSSNHYNKSSSSHQHRSKQRRSKSMAVSSSAANALTSNEARIRQLAKQQQELQPTSGIATTTTTTQLLLQQQQQQQQRFNQTNSFNSIATTNLNNSTNSSSIPAASAAAESTKPTTTTTTPAQQTATCSTTALLPNSSLLNNNNQKSSSSNLEISAEQRASSLLQLSGNNLNAAESQPLTAPAPILALTPPATNNNTTITTTSLSVVPNSNGASSDLKPTAAAPAGKSSSNNNNNKKSSPAVAFNEGRNNNNNDDQDDDDDDDDDLDSNSGQSTPTKRSISKMKREHKAAKTLGIIMGVFILCWLPFFSWYTPQHICGHACDGMVPRGAVTILFWIGYFNSTLNPIIYAYFNHEFRDAFKKTLQWLFCCCNDLKCLRVNRPNDNQHYNCTYRSTQEIGLVSNS